MVDIKYLADEVARLAEESSKLNPSKLKDLEKLKSKIRINLHKIRKEVETEKSLKKDPLIEIERIKQLSKIYHKQKEIKKDELKIDYTIYKTNELGMFANKLFEKHSVRLQKKYKGFFDKLYYDLISSNIKIISKTYISLILLGTLAAFIFSFLLLVVVLKGNIIFSIVRGLFLAVIIAALTFLGIYFYPSTVVNQRKRQIKNDLPFVILHMSAIAGSGANPISMFNLILKSDEYPGIKGEIKKIVNYVNLYGYDLTTAMKVVSLTTPSKDFKELLNGLVTTIETGGSLKEYLRAKSQDTMTTYKLDRTKYVESLAAYSDVYTGMLIAAPLLFFTVLAIIQGVGGGSIAGISVKTLAIIGTFVVLPLLNLGFMVFLNLTKIEK
ncbi:MAG: type II secretion system F family protein [Candidatus Nanoarchaeia archaeon]|nr:type II secretion system F family protein [Candidatus Nanoarchaeia archaeon]